MATVGHVWEITIIALVCEMVSYLRNVHNVSSLDNISASCFGDDNSMSRFGCSQIRLCLGDGQNVRFRV